MKITIIAPMQGIIDTINEMLLEDNFTHFNEIETVLGNVESGVEQALLAVERGADVIISRGGTASLIAENVDIPVVEIQVSAFDILRALKQCGVVTGMIGVVFTRQLLFECEKLGDFVGIKIKEFFLRNEVIEEDKIISAHKEGISMFIGDASSVRILKKHGYNAIIIESSKDAIAKAIIEAKNIADVRRKEQEKAELFRTIINASTDGVIGINKEGMITISNPVTEQIFQVNSASVIGKYIGDIIPDDKLRDCLSSDNYEQEGIKSIGNKMFAIKRIPIKLNGQIVGAVATIEDVTQLQQFEQIVRQKINKKGLVAKFSLEHLIGKSLSIIQVKERVRQYASTNATVLITGESGTGKELIAQSIHNLSDRKSGPFVAVNCAALPDNLLESELFGYEEGAFTGAKKGGKSGLFELAHKGTIFLDEIGELPLYLQARLLRVLQEKEVMRLGADSIIPVDVRVLSATNRGLMDLVEKKEFRTDLYYRLDVLRLHVPPLRERLDDIPDLVNNLLNKETSAHATKRFMTDDAIAFLQKYPWKGNIRELENVIERLKLMAKGPIIEESDVCQELMNDQELKLERSSSNNLKFLEREKIEQILKEEKYNYTQAAIKLGISRTTLWRKIRDWNDTY